MATKQTQRNQKRLYFGTPSRTMIWAVIFAALGALAIMIIVLPLQKNGTQSGVGADGFSVARKDGLDIGIGKVTDKTIVKNAMGSSVKDVSDPSISAVLSLNGNLGQTATYMFTTTNGTKGTVDVDVLKYKSKDSYDSDNVFNGTGAAGKINGMEVRYIPASTLGKDRIYALLITKDLKSYKFSISQPSSSVQIKEVFAQDMLKTMITKASL